MARDLGDVKLRQDADSKLIQALHLSQNEQTDLLRAHSKILLEHGIKIDALQVSVDNVRASVNELDARVEDRFDRMDQRFDRMDQRFDRMDERMDRMEGMLKTLVARGSGTS
ncbi:hypothetical protein [Cryptosporangium phraense]|uniref:hypothetical protein n=1 Tax=Cryptosporangium phraense TaxID=2593070 RepID=UPI0014786F72|nr:hypothetical protein [Cryptosporangium phraense]